MFRTFVLVLVLLLAIPAAAKRRYSVVDEQIENYGSGEAAPPRPQVEVPTKPPRTGMFATIFDALSWNNDAATVALANQHNVVEMPWFKFIMTFFPYEACGFATFGLAIVAYFANAKVNKLLVSSFLRNHIAILSTQFHRIDFGKEEENKQGATIMKDGPCYFRCFGSGRKNVTQCLTTFDLKHRQNIFHWAAQAARLVQDDDFVTMEAFLMKMPPIGLVVAKDMHGVTALLKAQPILGDLPTTRFTGWKNSTKLVCLCDSQEAAGALLVSNVENILSTAGEKFLSLTILDHCLSLDEIESNRALPSESDVEKTADVTTERSAMTLRGTTMISIRFKLNELRKQQEITPLVHLFFSFIDRVAELELSAAGLKKGIGMRQGLLDKQWTEIKALRVKEAGLIQTKKTKPQKKKDDLLS